MTEPSDRPKTPSEYLPHRIESVRRRREWTQSQLADAMNKWGNGTKIDRSTIAKIESGKRAVSVDEVFWFAAALEVSPLTLLLPRRDEPVRVVPEMTLPASGVVGWLRGLHPLIQGGTREQDRFFEEERPSYEVDAERRLPGLLEWRTAADIVVRIAAAGNPGEDRGNLISGDLAAIEYLDTMIEEAKRFRRRLARTQTRSQS